MMYGGLESHKIMFSEHLFAFVCVCVCVCESVCVCVSVLYVCVHEYVVCHACLFIRTDFK